MLLAHAIPSSCAQPFCYGAFLVCCGDFNDILLVSVAKLKVDEKTQISHDLISKGR
jgi:hypothetical protein